MGLEKKSKRVKLFIFRYVPNSWCISSPLFPFFLASMNLYPKPNKPRDRFSRFYFSRTRITLITILIWFMYLMSNFLVSKFPSSSSDHSEEHFLYSQYNRDKQRSEKLWCKDGFGTGEAGSSCCPASCKQCGGVGCKGSCCENSSSAKECLSPFESSCVIPDHRPCEATHTCPVNPFQEFVTKSKDLAKKGILGTQPTRFCPCCGSVFPQGFAQTTPINGRPMQCKTCGSRERQRVTCALMGQQPELFDPYPFPVSRILHFGAQRDMESKINTMEQVDQM